MGGIEGRGGGEKFSAAQGHPARSCRGWRRIGDAVRTGKIAERTLCLRGRLVERLIFGALPCRDPRAVPPIAFGSVNRIGAGVDLGTGRDPRSSGRCSWCRDPGAVIGICAVPLSRWRWAVLRIGRGAGARSVPAPRPARPWRRWRCAENRQDLKNRESDPSPSWRERPGSRQRLAPREPCPPPRAQWKRARRSALPFQ